MDLPPTPSTSSAAAEYSAGKKLNKMAAIKAEMALFSSSGARRRCLQTVYSWLLTIPPTSVEAERAFSAAGIFCTKLRSRLSDNSIDTLCFLRAYYQKRRYRPTIVAYCIALHFALLLSTIGTEHGREL